ncbi:hypothetical protein DS2_12323 [Catenovulum agarivorans DS-2]|uniref:Uncharacterized protein n=1 Tax=Catenovulum agarivorans DS-2 TaxID=1328313 RepID=W7QKI0_9ALTE|nr:hypothetical protein [Catenovulum agarivorans]EWH09467.1 hypothetical protein DS2_12323 [Catenovulum agarivorans DS-2]
MSAELDSHVSRHTHSVSGKLTEAELNHSYTPPELSDLNQLISQLLLADDVNDSELLALIDQRDECVQNTLEQLASTPEKQKQFALAESEVNNKLIHVCNQLVKQAKTDLTKLVKGRKAIRQYR